MFGRKKPQRPICGCKHDLAYHEPDGDGGGTICHAELSVRTGSDDNLMGVYEFRPCKCKQYTGPRILDPGYMAREMRIDPR